MTEVAALEIVRDHSLYYKVRWRWCSWWIWETWNYICHDDFYGRLIQLQTRNLNGRSRGARWRLCPNFCFDDDYDGSLFQYQGKTKIRFKGALWRLCAKEWSSPAIQSTHTFVHWDFPAVSFDHHYPHYQYHYLLHYHYLLLPLVSNWLAHLCTETSQVWVYSIK